MAGFGLAGPQTLTNVLFAQVVDEDDGTNAYFDHATNACNFVIGSGAPTGTYFESAGQNYAGSYYRNRVMSPAIGNSTDGTATEIERVIAAAAVTQARVEEAGIGNAVLGHALDGRHDDLAHDARMQLRRHHRRGRIGAHAAGVGSEVAVLQPLVVLAGRKRQRVHAIGHDDEARLFASEELLDDHARARGEDGFQLPWKGTVWLNPPYSSTYSWVNRLLLEADDGNVNGFVTLTFARTGASWAQRLMERSTVRVLFLSKRVRFIPGDGQHASSPGADSMVCAWGECAGVVERLRAAGHGVAR